MNDFFNSFSSWFKEKTTSSLYGAYTIAFLVWNWKIMYLMFWFHDELPDSQTRIDLINTALLVHLPEWYWQILNIAWIFIPPFGITYLMITQLPKLQSWAHKHNLKFYYQRKGTADDKLIEYERSRNKDLKEISKIKKEQKTSEKEIAKNMTDEEKWSYEYQELIQNHLFKAEFKDIITIIYENEGNIYKTNPMVLESTRLATPEIIALSHSRGIIEFNKQDKTRIEFTEKGKYHVSLYLQVDKAQ